MNFRKSIWPDGRATFVAAAAVTAGQPVKLTATEGEVTPCTAATDIAVGVAQDDADDGDTVPVALLGAKPGTIIAVATGEISAGAEVNALGAPATTGHTVIGRALQAVSSSGEEIELAHCVGRTK
jgi:predicted transcriptional regulator